MSHIAIVGGGISGLATAWFLRGHGHTVDVVEARQEVGGNIRSIARDGYLVDTGPTSTLLRHGPLGALIEDVGAGNDLIHANAASARRYIVKHRRLIALPANPLSFLTTPLFSAGGKLRMLLEPFHGRPVDEESVARFVRRRLGPEFLDWAIDPFVSGVYAGDPEQLSARAATAKVYALETEYRSLFLGAAARWLRGRASGPAPTGKLISFRSGMQRLPQAITALMPGSIRLGATVEAITPLPHGGWLIRAGDRELSCDRLVLAVPARQAAALLDPVDAALAAGLREIVYAPVATVALGFVREQVSHPLDGFGMLIPRRERIDTLGALFSSTLFPGRAPTGQVLLTAFIGGARNPGAVDLDEQALIEHVTADLQPLLGFRGSPAFTHVTRWPQAIPQYTLGHLERMKRLDARAARFPRLHFRANWRDGISVSDCVANANAMAESISRH